MNTTKVTLQGGPFDMSPTVSAAVIAHLEVLACADEGKRFKDLVKRRAKILSELGERDRRLLRVVGAAMVRFGEKPARRKKAA